MGPRGKELIESNPSGAHNFGVAPRFLEDLVTPELRKGRGCQWQGFETGTPL